MPDPSSCESEEQTARRFTRRELVQVGGFCAFSGGLLGAATWWKRHENGLRASTFVAKTSSYDDDLAATVSAGLRELGITRRQIRGKRVLLKPNLVETARGKTHINTHPAMVVAAAETFRRLDAAEVLVAEAAGHRRDSWIVADESGMGRALAEAGVPFVDLNHDDVEPVPNAGGWTPLDRLFLPKTLTSADIVVSMPKLKTHHWVGMTCSMKNLFGVMPGIVYGWPKNVLHWSGISKSILDINATVRPSLAIVDGIVGMEGDGPIMGTPKPAHTIIVGRNLPAVDAVCAQLIGMEAHDLEYLAEASGQLGPVYAHNITQRGETVKSLQTRFKTSQEAFEEHTCSPPQPPHRSKRSRPTLAMG